MRKQRTVDLMSEYFASKGKILSRNEYIQQNDGPLTLPAIKRSCGSWARMVAICERTHPDRMASTRGEELPPKEPVAEVPPTPLETEKPVRGPKTAAEALAQLGATNENQ